MDAERFMKSYMEVWPTFDAERLAETVDPETRIFHSGMEASISGAEEPDYVRAIKALMPDIELDVRNWAAGDDVIFVEYAMAGTLAGRRLEWEGIGRFTFEGDRLVDVVGRWDNLALLAAIDPEVEPTDFARRATELAAAQAA